MRFLIRFGLFLVVTFCIWGGVIHALTNPVEKYPNIDLYLESDALVWTPPTRFTPRNLAIAPKDITYWKKVLPYEQDRYADMYMVIPQLGLITPIQQIPRESTDFDKMIDGSNISINKYLQNGIIEYAGSVAPGSLGKRIDFGHSNFYRSDAGRYKTIFANLMRLDPGDEVWYFVRRGDQYDLYTYEVTASYPTRPSNVSILQRDGDGADALIFGCYHGLDGRWIIEADYIGTPKSNSSGGDSFSDIPAGTKSVIDSALYDLATIPLKWRKQRITYFYSRLSAYQTNAVLTAAQERLVEYLMFRLAELYQ